MDFMISESSLILMSAISSVYFKNVHTSALEGAAAEREEFAYCSRENSGRLIIFFSSYGLGKRRKKAGRQASRQKL